MLDVAADVTARNDTFSTEVERADRDVGNAMNNWKGSAATATSARSLSHRLSANHLGESLVTLADHLDIFGVELDGCRTALLGIVDGEVPAAGMTVEDDGNVTAPKVPSGTDKNQIATAMVQQILDAQAASFQSRIKNLLGQFGDAEGKAAQALTADLQLLADYETKPEGSSPLRTEVQAVLDGKAQLPTDPRQLHDFWETLTPAEKDALWQHDQYLGNRDGLPAVDRDRFNRMKLDDELARARAGDPGVATKVADLDAVAASLGNKPDRMLMVLDTQSGGMAHAAVAIGNPDTAQNVSVTAPGLNTSVHGSLTGMVNEAQSVRDTAEKQLQNLLGGDPRKGQTVATIAWIGADLPQTGSLDQTDTYLRPETYPGLADVASDDMAKNGARGLASFYDGLGASHDGDVHLTAVGHSYGSLMTGLALQEPGQHPVDDVLVYGSPGLDLPDTQSPVTGLAHAFGVDNPLLDTVTNTLGGSVDTSKLGVAPGHMYEMTAHNDPVAHFNAFGPSPENIPGFTHLETGATVTSDYVHRDGATGHSEYPRNGDNGQLRTTGWNTAMIVGGLPEMAVRAGPDHQDTMGRIINGVGGLLR
ncbi:alpha/beta hydrolase fold-containing protein [Nocardia nova SH22a]|uniref:Alpha/beta hydrolase fold-containing protein n=2 Tax=Nocardia nova TaxID=37330 RepID=W5TMN0_9NOCA|nr:alpha/beta hydrolase fold-containing protein [Nocardia nova SH22a]